MDALACGQGSLFLPDSDRRVPLADQVHFYAPEPVVVEGFVLIIFRHKLAIESVIQMAEHVAIEPGGQSLTVVVGRFQNASFLGQVGSDEQVAV